MLIISQEIVDEIVEAAYLGKSPDVDIEEITESDDIFTYGVAMDPFLILEKNKISKELWLSDAGVRERNQYEEGCKSDEGYKLSDEERIKYAVARAYSVFEDYDADEMPLVDAIELTDTNGREVLVVYELVGYSFTGVDVSTTGVFLSEEATHRHYIEDGYITSPEQIVAMEEGILEYWSTDVPFPFTE